jgi:DNA gyrase/topoisomerase IV subunit A
MAMLQDINEETVDFSENYDGKTQEPDVLPSRVPNLLINGSAGIAVGMATNIPPHNLREVGAGVVWALENWEATDDELLTALMERIKGPDFPTAGLIVGRDGIEQAYRTGRGSVRMRAVVEVEEDTKGRTILVATELPYQVNPDNLIESIAGQHRDGKLAGIAEINDESSDRIGMRIVITLKRDAVAKVVLNNLYKHTQLQYSFGVNMLAIVDGVPRTLRLDQVVRNYVRHQIEVIVRRTRYRLRKAEERAHILRGYVKALDALDEVIALIRASETVDVARDGLMQLLDVDEIQAQAILDMQLRRLAALERQKIIDELAEIEREIADLQDILARPERQRQIVRDELTEIVEKHGDDRRTQIIADDGDVTNEDLIAVEDVVVTITQTGYAKRTKTDLYRAQKRGGKGVQGAQLKQDDIVAHFFVCSTHDWILFFTNKGRVYRLKAYELPEANRSARGQHVANLLAFQPDEHIAQVMEISDYQAAPYLVLATKSGLVKKSKLTDFDSPRVGGLIGINLREDDELVGAVLCAASDDLLLVSAEGPVDPVHRERRGAAPHGPGHVRRAGDAVQRRRPAARAGRRARGHVRPRRHGGRLRQAHPDRGLPGAGSGWQGCLDHPVRPQAWHAGRGAHRRHRRRAVRDHLDGWGDPYLGPRGAQGRQADEGGAPDEPGRHRHAARRRAQRRRRRERRRPDLTITQESPHLVNDKTRTPDEPDRPAVAHPAGDGQGKHESARPADPHVVPAAPTHAAADGAGNGAKARKAPAGAEATGAGAAAAAAQPGAQSAGSDPGGDAASSSANAANAARRSAAGSAGGSGAAGSTGRPGAAGAAGMSGAVGSAGQSGAADPAGTSGVGGSAGQPRAADPAATSGVGGSAGQPRAADPAATSGVGGSAGQPGAADPAGTSGVGGSAGQSGVVGLSGAAGSAGESGAVGSAGDAGAGSGSYQRSAGAAGRAARDAAATRGAGVSSATPGARSREVAKPAVGGDAVDSAAMTTPAMSLRSAREPAAEPSAPTPPEGEPTARPTSSAAGSAALNTSARRQPGTPTTGLPRTTPSFAKPDDEPTTRMRFPAAPNGKGPAGDQKTQPVARQGTASAAVPMPGPVADAPPPWNRVPGQEPSPVLVENRPTEDAAEVEGPTAFLEPPAPPSPPNERKPGRPSGAAAPSRGGRTRPPRQASLQLKRLDPWSVLKLALVLAVVLFLIWLVAVGVLYGVLDGIGVWDRLNGTYADLVSGEAPSGSPLISAGRVFGIAAVVGAINSLLFAVAVTVGAFVYNVSADLVGGIEVTLSERD